MISRVFVFSTRIQEIDEMEDIDDIPDDAGEDGDDEDELDEDNDDDDAVVVTLPINEHLIKSQTGSLPGKLHYIYFCNSMTVTISNYYNLQK